jgi:hypothetical protein
LGFVGRVGKVDGEVGGDSDIMFDWQGERGREVVIGDMVREKEEVGAVLLSGVV